MRLHLVQYDLPILKSIFQNNYQKQVQKRKMNFAQREKRHGV